MIQKLEHRIALLQRHFYGQRRERFEDPRQQKLYEIDEELLKEAAKPEEESGDDSSSPAARPRRGHDRRRLPEDLMRREKTYELTEEERQCPCCGKLRSKVSQVVSEQLELQPAKLFAIRVAASRDRPASRPGFFMR